MLSALSNNKKLLRPNFIYSAKTIRFNSNFWWNLVTIARLAIDSTYHIIYNIGTFSLFYDSLRKNMQMEAERKDAKDRLNQYQT